MSIIDCEAHNYLASGEAGCNLQLSEKTQPVRLEARMSQLS